MKINKSVSCLAENNIYSNHRFQLYAECVGESNAKQCDEKRIKFSTKHIAYK